MQPTQTQFKQKSCIKCKTNHNNDGVLCDFCKAEAERALNNRAPTPASYWLECLIVRDGDTTVHLGNVPYVFKKNTHGHSVCEVVNHGHYNALLKMPHLYTKYTPPIEEAPSQEDVAEIYGDDPLTSSTDEKVNRLGLIFSMQPLTMEVADEPVSPSAFVTVDASEPVTKLPTLAELIQTLHTEGKTDTEIAAELGNGLTRQRVTKIREADNAGKTPTC